MLYLQLLLMNYNLVAYHMVLVNHPFILDECIDKGDTEVLLPRNKNPMPPICPVYWALALKSVTRVGELTCKPWGNRFKMVGI